MKVLRSLRNPTIDYAKYGFELIKAYRENPKLNHKGLNKSCFRIIINRGCIGNTQWIMISCVKK